MSNDPAANLERMYSYLDDARDADGPGHVVVDQMMLSDWCSALARTIGEADGSTLAGQQDAIALLRAEIELLRGAQSTALSLLGDIIKECHNAGLPNEIVVDRVIERVEVWAMEARNALGGHP